ncbi:hypothetical protein GYA54_03665 [Candidatus Kuenenbacteria bacterium]|nr:hypothetical protein [Candidatus Kuenenbacteria bacterium]
MKFYHGSRNGNLNTIKKQQAAAAEGLVVPEDELLNAIYLTPRYDYALAMAARPEGVTHIDTKNNIIEFEHPELFDPEKEVYIYEVEVPEVEARQIDDLQWVVENREEVGLVNKSPHKAGEIEQYYRLKNWAREGESEFRSGLRRR